MLLPEWQLIEGLSIDIKPSLSLIFLFFLLFNKTSERKAALNFIFNSVTAVKASI